MMASKTLYIWQQDNWKTWQYQRHELIDLLNQVYHQQGLLLGRMQELGWDLRQQASLTILTQDVVKSSEIEGEKLSVQSVRSSIARKLGMDIGALSPVERYVEGVVEMMLDATIHFRQSVTDERLFSWHAALFPTGYSGLSKIAVAQYRDDSHGAMQVISGAYGKEKIHYQAPPAENLSSEMVEFLDWINHNTQHDKFIKAAIAHLWFLTLHPFEDGNGRIARALGDLLLTRADGTAQRFYSLSAQIQKTRNEYYFILEQTQKGNNDITEWLIWFLQSLISAMQAAQLQLNDVLFKAKSWQQWRAVSLNERQIKVLNRLLDGFDGQLNNRKWVAMTGCSRDTALRDITDLLDKGILKKSESGGRSVFYTLNINI
nr:Fic family protein [Pelistega sp. MC2]